MKLVIPYTRVSTDEQAFGYSLKDQDARLTEYCQKNGYIIAAKFEDDYTGKTFDRPGFKKMLAFIKRNKVDEVLFIKWTRFSRNTTDALVMIRDLAKMGVGVQSIDEPIDFEVPQSKFMLNLYLNFGEVDNDIRSDNTCRGIRRKLKEGGWANRAPFGYINKRENNKAFIVIDEQAAPLVKEAFELMSTGDYSQEQIRAKVKGLKMSKTRFSLMLKNPVYCGNIFVPAYKKEPSKTVKGTHEPIISEAIFYRVQDVIKGHRRVKVKKYRKVVEDFHLSGFLYCNQDHKMTFSHSRGRHGNLFPYYHCPNHLKCERCRAMEANDSFLEHLSTFTADPDVIQDFRMIYEYAVKQDGESAGQIQKRISDQQSRIEILQDKLIDGKISDEDYSQIRSRYESTLYELKSKVNFIQVRDKEVETDIEQSTKLLSNLVEYFSDATPQGKQEVFKCIFTPHGRVYFDVETKKCRTPIVDPYVSLIINADKAFSEPKILQLNEYRQTFPSVARKEHSVEPLSLIFSIKRLSETFKMLRA